MVGSYICNRHPYNAHALLGFNFVIIYEFFCFSCSSTDITAAKLLDTEQVEGDCVLWIRNFSVCFFSVSGIFSGG